MAAQHLHAAMQPMDTALGAKTFVIRGVWGRTFVLKPTLATVRRFCARARLELST